MDTVKAMFLSGGDGSSNGDSSGAIPNSGEMPSREEMVKTIESLQKAQKAQSIANDIKSKAFAMTDSKKREEMIRNAFDKEMEANGHSKMAKRLQSGGWQGLGFGGGIGAATGIGLGAGLGTVLGAVTAVPAAGLGMLVGSGVGAIRGPWIKLGDKEEKFEDADPEKVVDALEEERTAQTQSGQGGGTPGESATTKTEGGAEQKTRRKPKKLEIRSKPKGDAAQQEAPTDESSVQKDIPEESKPRRKPKKLEIRSKKSGSGSGTTSEPKV